MPEIIVPGTEKVIRVVAAANLAGNQGIDAREYITDSTNLEADAAADLAAVVELIAAEVEENDIAYLFCDAGRMRSRTAVAAYLFAKHGIPLARAIAMLNEDGLFTQALVEKAMMRLVTLPNAAQDTGRPKRAAARK